MNQSLQSPIHSVAIALLAMAVIVLAIKEPRDCVNPSNEVNASNAPSAPAASGRNPASPQRELRKF